jgi:hypothetical protein
LLLHILPLTLFSRLKFLSSFFSFCKRENKSGTGLEETKNKEKRKGVDKTGRENGRDKNRERKMCGGNGVRKKEEWRTNEMLLKKGYKKKNQLMKVRRK